MERFVYIKGSILENIGHVERVRTFAEARAAALAVADDLFDLYEHYDRSVEVVPDGMMSHEMFVNEVSAALADGRSKTYNLYDGRGLDGVGSVLHVRSLEVF